MPVFRDLPRLSGIYRLHKRALGDAALPIHFGGMAVPVPANRIGIDSDPYYAMDRTEILDKRVEYLQEEIDRLYEQKKDLESQNRDHQATLALLRREQAEANDQDLRLLRLLRNRLCGEMLAEASRGPLNLSAKDSTEARLKVAVELLDLGQLTFHSGTFSLTQRGFSLAAKLGIVKNAP